MPGATQIYLIKRHKIRLSARLVGIQFKLFGRQSSLVFNLKKKSQFISAFCAYLRKLLQNYWKLLQQEATSCLLKLNLNWSFANLLYFELKTAKKQKKQTKSEC